MKTRLDAVKSRGSARAAPKQKASSTARAPAVSKRAAKPQPADAMTAATPVRTTPLDGAPRTTRVIGPEAAGKPGDVVKAPRIDATPAEVLSAKQRLDAKVAKDPAVLARLRSAPYPRSEAAQLEWALARPSLPNLQNPVWTLATNDARAAMVAYVQGVVSASAAGVQPSAELEQLALAAQNVPFETITALQAQPFPAGGTVEQQLQWAYAITISWDWTQNPSVTSDPLARGMVSFVNGAMAKAVSDKPVTLSSERRTLTVDGDTRVFAIHTPPGKPPPGGWPTVMFFHGSYGGYAPEQTAEYQALNALAAAQGFQVVYPVGLPQDRADSQTGRGMLNWDPVGAGPKGANDRFVHELLKKLTASKGNDRADATRVFAAGHSQGGFYSSNLVAAYPDVFAGAAVLGAGLGSVAEGADLSAGRKTPTLLRVGVDDIHLTVGDRLAARFQSAGFGDAFRFDRLPGRGHEVVPDDLTAMLDFFAAQPAFTASQAGKLDGNTSPARPRPPVFRETLDLRNLPPALLAQPYLTRALQALAQNPYLNADQNPARFTLQEWRLAQQYRDTFPPAMQQAIEGLRPFFVVAPPPTQALDLNAIPPKLQQSANAMAALQLLWQSPLLDLDGYPGLLTAEEVLAGVEYRDQLAPHVAAGLDELRAFFFGGAVETGFDLRVRASETLPGGAKLETYPGSEAAAARMRAMVKGLNASPTFAAVLAKTTLVITPPGRGVEALPELEGFGDGIEGVASGQGFAGGGRSIRGPAFIIREDSMRRWDLGAAHELLHLLRQSGGDAAYQRVVQVWNAIGGKDGQPDGYPNAEEMFAYLGQWYLAGFHDELKQVSPEAFALLRDMIGEARVSPGAMTKADALTSLQGLMAWFRSGQHNPGG